jgi:hypothetical protein
MHFRLGMISVAAACLLLAGGCSRSERPPLGTVTGTVTLDGRPLADAVVAFTPEGPGRTSLGTTDAAGRYRLAYLRDIPGANPGRHVVRITTASVDEGRPEILPATYHRRSNLEAQVEPGDNTIDFALKAK